MKYVLCVPWKGRPAYIVGLNADRSGFVYSRRKEDAQQFASMEEADKACAAAWLGALSVECPAIEEA